jgi:DNA-directed RNA polymerase specialized sigma24 family protein
MGDTLKFLVETVRNAASSGEDTTKARNALARGVRELFVRCLVYFRGCSQSLAEDLAQDKTQRLVEYLSETDSQYPEAVVKTAAFRKLIDEQRFRKRRRHKEHDSIDAVVSGKEGRRKPVLEKLDRQRAREWENDRRSRESKESQLALVKEGLARLPEKEHQLLEAVYVNGESIDALAKKELDNDPTVQRGSRKGELRTITEARCAVDQRLSRARKLLRQLINNGGSDQ